MTAPATSLGDRKLEDYLSTKPTAPSSILEAFANTAKALQQYGVERIRVVGLSRCCTVKPPPSAPGEVSEDVDGVRVVTEHDFMREFVFHSRPCIILDAIDDWPAMRKWRSDRYVFDLDHQLPSEEEWSATEDGSEGDTEEEDGDVRDAARHCEQLTMQKKTKEAAQVAVAVPAMPKPRGPKKVTIALTPNGRADAVTYVLYDERDVPLELRETVCNGKLAEKMAVVLSSHPLLTVADHENTHLRMEKIFMYAAEVKVTLPELYGLLRQSPSHDLTHPVFIDMRRYKDQNTDTTKERTPVVAYAQLQNNCLNTEYEHLHNDIRTNIEEFGTRVFGEAPEAANVWIGVPSSVSSLHQDWVENLYPVVRGVKEFLLIPPWEGYFVPKPDTPSASFALDADRTNRDALQFAFRPYPLKDGTVVPWMDFDFTANFLEEEGDKGVLDALLASIEDNNARKPRIDPRLCSGASTSSTLKSLHPLVVRVLPGETLYLPAMWLHRVSQVADTHDARLRARHAVESSRQKATTSSRDVLPETAEAPDGPVSPLPLIVAVNYWYNMSFTNPAVVMLREFGLLL